PRKDLVSSVLRFDDLPQSLQLFAREIRALVLGEREEHQKAVRGWMPELDHSRAAALSTARSRPTKFSQATCSGYDTSGGWPPDEVHLKSAVLLITQEATDTRREGARLDDDHSRSLRHWRTLVKRVPALGRGFASPADA
ncbi:MAG: hypothetical protein M3547_05685, partial [Acidobacteriota bacterium]|nr:hypothetical protein [Acidobacteriota bacterium]